MSQSILLPENHSLMSFEFISSCDNSTTWLPRYWWAHGFSSFFCNRLNRTFGISVAFGGTDVNIHHFISGKAFSSIFSLNIDCKEVAIWSPRESGIIWECLLILVERYLIDEIKLHIKLNKSAIFSNNIKILLSGWERCCSDSILILCFDINNRIRVNGEYWPCLSNT